MEGLRLAFDVEANGLLLKTTDMPALSRIHCLVTQDIDTREIRKFRPHEIEAGLRHLMQAELVIGHNIIGYDLLALQRAFPWFKIEKSRVVDTLILSRLLFPNLKDHDFDRPGKIEGKLIGSHKLEAWGQRLGTFKIAYDGGWEEFSEVMLDYCVGDVEVSVALYLHLIALALDDRASALEHGVEFITSRQYCYGFPFDIEKARLLTADLQKRLVELEAELSKTFKPWFEPDGEVKRAPYDARETDAQKEDVSLWKGWWGYRGPEYEVHRKDKEGNPKFKKNGKPDTYMKSDFFGYKFQKLKYIEFNPNSNQHIIKRLKHLYNWKHVSTEVTPSGQPKIDDKILGKLPYPEAKPLAEYKMVQKRLGLLIGADEDKGWLNVYSEDSGIPRVHGSIIANGAVTGRGTHKIIANIPRVTTPYGKELRGLFKASPGRVQVGIDVSSLEFMILSHFLAKWDNGAMGAIVMGGDFHTANQLAAGLPTRDMAKTFIYAFLYGGGDQKLGSIALPLGTEAQQKALGKKLRATFIDKVPGLKSLTDALKAACKKGYIVGLDGRHIPLRSDHSALNFLLQSAGSLLCKQWMVMLDDEISKRNWHNVVSQLIWYHDELQFDVVPEYAEEFGKLAIETIGKAGEFFNLRVPLTGEYKTGQNWKECH